MSMNWNDLLSTARVDHDGCWTERAVRGFRHQWHRDQDRIIFSSAFRRLAVKTQVHPLSKNDHIRTRLSHSLEVASIGRSKCKSIYLLPFFPLKANRQLWAIHPWW